MKGERKSSSRDRDHASRGAGEYISPRGGEGTPRKGGAPLFIGKGGYIIKRREALGIEILN